MWVCPFKNNTKNIQYTKKTTCSKERFLKLAMLDFTIVYHPITGGNKKQYNFQSTTTHLNEAIKQNHWHKIRGNLLYTEADRAQHTATSENKYKYSKQENEEVSSPL